MDGGAETEQAASIDAYHVTHETWIPCHAYDVSREEVTLGPPGHRSRERGYC